MKTHNIDVSEKTIKEIIKNCLNNNLHNKETITDIIYHFINTRSDGPEVFLSAYLGSFTKPTYKVDDIVWISQNNLYITGSVCKETSKNKGCYDGSNYRARIVTVDEYSKYQYKVDVKYWTEDNEFKEKDYWIREDSIKDLIVPSINHINLGDLI